MVVSVSTSHLIHTRTTEPEMDKLDAVEAGIGKRFLGVPKFASRWGGVCGVGLVYNDWSSGPSQTVFFLAESGAPRREVSCSKYM